MIPLIIGITLAAFLLLKSLPGEPALNLVGVRASAEQIKQIRSELGDDKSVLIQYLGYIKLLSHGDLGRSYYTGRVVLKDILAKFPNTVMLTITAMMIAAIPGILLGFFSISIAQKKENLLSRLIDWITLGSLSIPVFWSGIILMMIFGLTLKILPPSGTGGIRYIILPAITLAIPAMSSLARITRTIVSDILKKPFIITAKAKGLKESRIAVTHVLRNAMIPIVTVIGLDFGSYLNGSVITETIFGWDGIGRFTMEAIIMRDYPVIMGCVMLGAVVNSTVNLITDIVYNLLDPRVRQDV
ncbi:MAG: ABC transporter permease [Nitrospirae bacterium]|nr:ABC transporter permease [Nitrospirota bacterium]